MAGKGREWCSEDQCVADQPQSHYPRVTGTDGRYQSTPAGRHHAASMRIQRPSLLESLLCRCEQQASSNDRPGGSDLNERNGGNRLPDENGHRGCGH